ncbi:CGNR zinc finger domain-containing protein [Actinomadura vinacea]|uniref:CGNR zinc finger domain-containing protein n=1 Tax=Actinomadura vinacea TaxID=115336 RepID=UPI0031CF3AAF
MSDPEFPILGTEPFAVELANTLYGSGDQRIDFFQTAEWIDRWFALVAPGHGLAAPGTAAAHDVRELRDCVHGLLSAAVERRTPDMAVVERLNGFAMAAPTHLRLEWPVDGGPAARLVDTTTGAAAILGRVAHCCIELLAGPQAGGLRRCRGPGCSLLFVKDHSRRRWCHPSCGHRDRQARYYRRRLDRAEI